MLKYPIFLQDNENSCGAYCIKMLLSFYKRDDEIKNILEQSKEAICKLSFAGNIEISSSVQKEKCASAVNEYAKIYIPLGELVDKNAEIARLTKELENAKKQLEGTSKRLLDENFTSKAPEKVINGAKEMKASLENKVQNLLNSISELREIWSTKFYKKINRKPLS